MSTPTVTRAVELAAQLGSAGIASTLDPKAVLGLAPCVLLPPPRLDFNHPVPVKTWRLLAVSSLPAGLPAWQELDELVHAVADVLFVEAAEPASYALAPGEDPRPAYALTLTGA